MKVAEIRVTTESNVFVTSIEDWLKLEINEKLTHLKKGTVAFLSNGEPVPLSEALESLRPRR